MTKPSTPSGKPNAGRSSPVYLKIVAERPVTGHAITPSRNHKSKAPEIVSFDRRELSILLNVYGRKVASGEWRDYAMDMLSDRAMFSIYRHASERPQFIIEKNPKLRNRQGQYNVINYQGRTLKRGHDLANVVRVLEPYLAVVK